MTTKGIFCLRYLDLAVPDLGKLPMTTRGTRLDRVSLEVTEVELMEPTHY
jgi:hypothetical protein